MSAALIGSGVGLSLGAAYLAGGMAQHAADHSRVARIAEAAAGGYSSDLLQDAKVLRLTVQEPAAAAQARQLAELTQRLEREQEGGKASAQRELECLTQAVYYEARGESPRGQFAVAQVVMNRVKHPAFPKTVCGVVFQGAGRRTGCQFSFACDGSMRGGHEASAWKRARKVASRVLAGAAIADVGSATHFHTTAVAPAWGPQMRRVAQVGMHVFYRFSPRKAVQAASQPVLQNAVLTSTPAQPVEYRLMNAVTAVAPAEAAPAPSAEASATPAAAEAKPAVQPAKPGAKPPAAKAAPPSPPTLKPAEAAALQPATDAAAS